MTRIAVVAGLCLFAVSGSAVAQEHYSEGPVWACSAYRVKEGKGDDYMKYIRSNALVIYAKAKEAGQILDFKMFTQVPARPSDWNFMACQLFSSFGKALDYSAAGEQTMNAIQAEHWKTADRDKISQLAARRYELREYLGTSYVREITLKPMP
jgi:hypothetical protein